MPARHLSIRMDEDALDRLDAESRRTGRTRSDIAKTLLDEGLRMERHPGIVFCTGPAGRRPALAVGPDVWEVARVVRDLRGGPGVIEQAAELTGLPARDIEVVIRYYAEHAAEIDAWIDRVDAEAAEAEQRWQREQALLQR
ncbi:MAG: ribbon-helix-helix protein, CopG family [Chloroflexi bacterium]|nr:ribbon-helix-helix protein, CopG family [Chloroflexota bacterium]MDA1239314.1 ribbon-helix-helix protein, CopG family [Chloroflexota bacterium]